MRSWTATEGSPSPLGVTWLADVDAFNFALYSKHATGVTLLLYREDDLIDPVSRIELSHLKNKSGRIWHCRLYADAVRGAKYYAYSITGPTAQESHGWHAFDPEKILLDPYARAVYFPPRFDRGAASGPGGNAGRAPLGVLRRETCAFDWGSGRRPRHESDLIIYELHIKGFTYHPSSGVSEVNRGTYSGLTEKIPYLQELGITAVELMPVFQFDPQEDNYWGYMPLSFFAPHNEYAVGKGMCQQHDEFRAMVKAFHDADIEVIVDVVYNHTAEGNHRGATYTFKGIDNSTYYLMSGRSEDPYINASGTGNTLHCSNRYVRKMIVDSLRYWVREMHVDGFRFDLASIFALKGDGSLNADDPPIFGDILSDPDLSNVRLIAEPWDAANVYQLGRAFPGTRWSQWNARFRDDVRRFIRGDPGLVPSIMTRLYGSDDLFPDTLEHAYHPYQSVNFITAHDGFTLYDLVSYDHKHNWANGHNNTDGPPEESSWNCGWEGDEGLPAEVLALRKRQVKNFICLLLVSNGTPMLRAGDEFLQTQGGNSNPYNQDNETSWLNWSRLGDNDDIFRFLRNLIAFRKARDSLSRSRFWRSDVHWYGPVGAVDMSWESRTLAYLVDGESEQDADIYVMINAGSQPVDFTIQDNRPISRWKRFVDTGRTPPDDCRDPGSEVELGKRSYTVQARSIVVLVA